MKELSDSLPDDLNLWKARAEAALPIIEAAMNLTKAHHFEISTRQGIVVDRDRYQKLTDAVEVYINAALSQSN